ncbi:MAG TPA: CvpA family protein [Candidatus Omnitrophota bacterium]|nr:CvpA family protein [Candidatus Omnitrophota bacterium]
MKITTDYITLGAFLYFFFSGWRKGFFKILLAPFSLVAGCAIGYMYYQKTQNMMIGLGICILGPFAINMLASIILRLWHKAVNGSAPLSSLSRILGGAVSLLWGGSYLALMLVMIGMTPLDIPVFKKVQNDVLASKSYALIKWQLGDKIPDALPDIQKITHVLKDPKKIEAFQSTDEFQAVSSDERVKAIFADEKTAEQIKNKDYAALLSNPKMQELFQDKELLKKIFALNKRLSQEPPAQESGPKIIEIPPQ